VICLLREPHLKELRRRKEAVPDPNPGGFTYFCGRIGGLIRAPAGPSSSIAQSTADSQRRKVKRER